jgi:hypothetical protein
MFKNISIRAGREAGEIIRDKGLNGDDVEVLAGASGGPKWLVLSGFDEVLPDFFKGRRKELKCISSSIGSFRFAAHGQKAPLTALEILREKYIAQSYSDKPSLHDVSTASRAILDSYITDKTAREVLSHPFMRLNIITARSTGLGKGDRPLPSMIHLGLAAWCNLFSRKTIQLFFKRALFFDARSTAPMDNDTIATEMIELTKDNLKDAVLASGSIPLVMEGVSGIPGAPGVYRDGGVVDYHLDIPFRTTGDGLVLFPHFYDYIIPGWFDKMLPWRRGTGDFLKRVVLISPSAEFVKKLPLGKIPDRNDFTLFMGRDKERISYWNRVTEMSRMAGEEFMEAVSSGKISEIVRPL